MSETLPVESRVSLWRDRRLWLVVAVALTVRTGLLASALHEGLLPTVAGPVVSTAADDAAGYIRPARSFLATGTFSQDEKPPYAIDTVRTPGYPLFLAEIWRETGDGNYLTVALAQFVLSLAAVVLVYAAARRLAGRRAALVAGLLLALSGLSAALPCYVLSDAVYQFCMALWLFLLVRYVLARSWGNLLAVAAVAGLGLYVRPVGLLFPAVVAVAALRPRFECRRTVESRDGHNGGLGRRLGQAAVALLIPALIVFPWMVRNKLGADTWEMTTIASENLLKFRAPEVQSIADGKVYNHEAQTALAREAESRTPAGATVGERIRIGRAVALEYLWHHPWATARAYANGAVVLLLLPDRWSVPHLLGVEEQGHVLHGRGGWYEKARTVLGQYHKTTLAYMTWETAWLVLVWLLALVGWLRLRRWGLVAASNALGLVVLCLLAASICPETEPRLRAPLLIPLVVLAGAMWLHSTGRVEGGTVRGPI
jgi:hypothetical protein